ncbi:MAG TPA: MarR family transcriptional regulator [Opitutaceae bacterium]|nr:MarR family transcriptional regulator [Opitutaceae bacterium]
MASHPQRSRRVSRDDYMALASFRHALRGFMYFSAKAARAEKLSPQQQQALLAIKGFSPGRHISIGDLAEHLYRKHNSTVGLVDRLVKRKLVRRSPGSTDRRKVFIELTPQGEAMIDRLSASHREELRRIGPGLRHWLQTIAGDER